jgi:hypothetical protein
MFDTISKFAIAIITVFIIAFFYGILVYLLWNWLMPVIFGLPVITFWQAIGLSWLSACLFKSSNTTTKD